MDTHTNTSSLVEIPFDDITPSPTQPRTRMEPPALDELAASIREQGILQPITVRPHPADDPPTTYELVAGERRWRAGRLAGLSTITARVRVLTDREVLEVQLVENAQRAEVHPLDEGDAYRRLHEQHGVSVEEIAARTGHPVGRIRQRLTLASLGHDGREALLAGKLLLGVALKVARLGAGDQRAAVEHLTKPAAHGGGARWTEDDAGAWIKGRYYLRLGTAPFDATDARLLQGVPPCAACPSNTLSQGNLFEDLGDAHCLDPDCFRRKTAAQWNRQTRDLAEAGRVVASIEESDAALVGGSPAKGYVRADDKPEEFGGKKTWRALLAKAAPTVVLVRNPATQEIVEMIRPADLKAAVASVGLTKKARAPHQPEPVPAAAVHLSEAAQARELAVLHARLEAVAIAAQDKPIENERAFWQVLTRAVAFGVGADAFNAVISRRHITAATDLRARHIAFDEEVESITARACRGLVLELLSAAALLAPGDLDDATGALLIAEHLGVDLRAVKRAALEALDAPAKVPAKPKGKGKAAEPPAPAGSAAPLPEGNELVQIMLREWPPTGTRGLDVIGDGRIVLWTFASPTSDELLATVPADLARVIEARAGRLWDGWRSATRPVSVIEIGAFAATFDGPMRVLGVAPQEESGDGVVLETPQGPRVAWLDNVVLKDDVARLTPATMWEVEEGADGTWIATRVDPETAKAAKKAKRAAKGGAK
jgi:ParB/RepB/Spo0J family partition protein